MEIRKIVSSDLKTGPGYSTPVISNAQKFIIPVPAFKQDGELLVYPKDHPNAGQSIVDYQGKPIGDRGIIFYNAKDETWQAAAGDGNDVIIINEVTQEQAEKLYEEIEKIGANLDELTLNELKQIMTFAQEDLKLDDMYNSTRAFVKKKMTSVSTDQTTEKRENKEDVYGFKKRDDRDINQAIYIPGEFTFEGPAVSPQKFKNGGIIIEQGGKMRGIQPDIFTRTYKFPDGRSIQSASEEIQSQPH
ncbi:hypothetical protein [Spirosoma validum]|uniref:Uncharacterized protein n=1 Tax=Spirosoma validum TaxID=2771355 RepID=A0A927B1B5_9BACT|nr:hypothetical protein [Spirosoma validum]MBD2753432.1 hypothetical protein [Spirosoma validum]